MPYLEYLFCETCGNYAKLDLDPASTIEAYNKEGRESSSINQATILWDFLIYSCDICGNKYKYTYRDVEKRVREYFSTLSLEYKDYFDKVISDFEDGIDISNQQASVEVVPIRQQTKIHKRIKDVYTAKK